MKYCASKYSHSLIAKTKQVWQGDSIESISDQEAVEIIENTIALYELLAELEEKYGKE